MRGNMPDPSSEESQRPEEGVAIVEGIAIGRAIVWAGDPASRPVVTSTTLEHLRLDRAVARATSGVEELVRLLPRAEAELFEPELAILSELRPVLLERVDAGMRAEDCVNEATSLSSNDLLADARARLLDGLAYDERSVEGSLEGRDGDRVLVTPMLTPSVVATLPSRVVGIVASAGDATRTTGYTSHAAILARARDIPLVLMRPEMVRAVRHDDTVVLDATTRPASVWFDPLDATLLAAQSRREGWMRRRVEEEASVVAPLHHLGIEVQVNVGSLHEHIPGAAEGIGLLRTEIVFSNRSTAPSETEQFGALCAIAARVGRAPVVVRLFDAGDDKPLPWLRAPLGSRARGIELLLMHPAVLDTQLRAITRAAQHANIRVLLPLVTSVADIEYVRTRTGGSIPVGAMVETPDAVERIGEIAAAADFVSIGTNDLFALVTGQGRVDSALSLDRRVLSMVENVLLVAHARARKVSVCGEMAGDPHGARILVGLGVDALSVATGRFAKVKLSLRDVSRDDCREMASEALRSP
jgi:phosphoenolpyruvate-protein kinase (PTS system EI component)